jgi:putative Holliday junction resolvase
LTVLSNLDAWLARLGLDPARLGDPARPALAAGSSRPPGLLALDVSKRALGVAGADAGWRLATPLVTIRRRRWAQDLARLDRLVAARAAGALVIGWPLNMDGSEGPRCQAVRAFADALALERGLPILLWDERLSTFAAEEAADQAGLQGQRRAEMLDALAAAAILQDALDALARSAARAAPQRPPGA